jgi:UV DNA damage endonuclease
MYNLCCMSIELKKKNVNHRAFRFTQFEKHDRDAALAILGERCLENVNTTLTSMRYAHANGWGYRISSTIFPLFNLAKAEVGLDDLPNAQDIRDSLNDIHTFTSTKDPRLFRLSFHPDHFNVLCSANDGVIERSINELQHHGWMMDEMAGINSRSYWYPLNIHMSRSSGDPKDIAKKFIKSYNRLNDSVKSRLVLENEDKGVWTPDMLIELIHNETGIPVTFDNLHHRCNPGKWEAHEAFENCIKTWRDESSESPVIPLFHYSEGGANNNPRAHVDFGEGTPKQWRYLNDTDYTKQLRVDWDIELKQKDYAIRYIQECEEKKTLTPA